MSAALDRLLDAWTPPTGGDEDDFLVKLRIQSRWDEGQFGGIVRRSRDVLAQLESGAPSSALAQALLDRHIEWALALMSHSGFRAEPPEGLDADAYEELLDERVAELRRIREAYLALATSRSGTPEEPGEE